MTPKYVFSFIFKNFVIDFCWKHTKIKIDIVIYFTVQVRYPGKFLFSTRKGKKSQTNFSQGAAIKAS